MPLEITLAEFLKIADIVNTWRPGICYERAANNNGF
jgi:hypothetical protein